MAEDVKFRASMSEIRFATPLARPMLMMRIVQTPLLPAAEEAKLLQDHSVTVQSDGDAKRWRALAGWLDEPANAKVVCRKTGLQITLGSPLDTAIELLPLAAGSPAAELVFFAAVADGTRQERRLPLQVMLDVDRRWLMLVQSFTADDAGREQYGAVVAAMTDPAAKATARITCTHDYRHLVQLPGPSLPPQPMRPWRPPGQTPPIIARPKRNMAMMAAQIENAEPFALAAGPHPTIAVARQLAVTRDFRFAQADLRRVVITPPEPPDQPPTAEAATLLDALTVNLLHPLDEPGVFPEELRRRQGGWGQVPGREGRPALHFRDSDRPDTFFYLPTRYGLGFWADADGGIAPPLRVSSYLDPAGEYRVRATLTALPQIDAADREVLRAHLREVVLQSHLPFVRLELAAGLQPRFIGEFTAATPGGEQQQLPAGIVFTALELVPDQRLVLQFDMEAANYTFFCALLRKGLRGRISLTADGVQEAIDVRLRLDELATNALRLQQDAAGPPAAAPEAATAGTAKGLRLSAENALSLPVTLASLRVVQIDTGPVPGQIFDAETRDMLPPAGLRLEPGATSGFAVDPPARMTDWDETVLVVGPAKVEGGSAEDWLARVHQDPSLQPQRFKVKVSAVIPAAGIGRVQLLRLKLFRAGEATARDGRDLPPGTTTCELLVPLSLVELAGGEPPAFFLDAETLSTDGNLSLPQRARVDLTRRELTLLALVESTDATYTVDYEMPGQAAGRQELDRAGAEALIRHLRDGGGRWQVFARAAAPPAG